MGSITRKIKNSQTNKMKDIEWVLAKLRTDENFFKRMEKYMDNIRKEKGEKNGN